MNFIRNLLTEYHDSSMPSEDFLEWFLVKKLNWGMKWFVIHLLVIGFHFFVQNPIRLIYLLRILLVSYLIYLVVCLYLWVSSILRRLLKK